MGIPYLPVRTALGSDLLQSNPSLRVISCPFTQKPLVAVAAIRPDVAVVHVQRCDKAGNALSWGNLGVTRDACLASRRVLVTAEEIVDTERITRDPNRVLIPGFKVDAVVLAPWGGHPSPVPGFYNRDHRMFLEYREENRDGESGRSWRQRWIAGSRPYVERLGSQRLEALKIRHSLRSEPVEYGY
jgi:glutaconate CoA-transferase subunit A